MKVTDYKNFKITFPWSIIRGINYFEGLSLDQALKKLLRIYKFINLNKFDEFSVSIEYTFNSLPKFHYNEGELIVKDLLIIDDEQILSSNEKQKINLIKLDKQNINIKSLDFYRDDDSFSKPAVNSFFKELSTLYENEDKEYNTVLEEYKRIMIEEVSSVDGMDAFSNIKTINIFLKEKDFIPTMRNLIFFNNEIVEEFSGKEEIEIFNEMTFVDETFYYSYMFMFPLIEVKNFTPKITYVYDNVFFSDSEKITMNIEHKDFYSDENFDNSKWEEYNKVFFSELKESMKAIEQYLEKRKKNENIR